MRIDVILATYNRAALVGSAIDSFAAARVPDGCRVRLLVVDNNSTDGTREAVAAKVAALPGASVVQAFEPRQGKAHALNAGVAMSDADVLGFFDDDERLAPDWLEAVRAAFGDKALDFAGGPVLPDWSQPPPPWLPREGWGGVLSLVDHGPGRRRYGEPGFGAMLIGANAAIRRDTLLRCGPYTTEFKWAEDRDMHRRLLAMGAAGLYLPEMRVWHHLPAKRLTKRYFRQWAYSEGRTEGSALGTASRGVAGAPAWMWRAAAEGAARAAWGRLRGGGDPDAFAAELDVRRFAGFWIERNARFIRHAHFDRT